jgi:hypothetical protein
MRKHLRLVALIIPMVLVASNSYAAVKAGSSCSKAGIKLVSAGKTYTCVKSGKKLVWNKGVAIAVAKPAPSATASAAPAASASPAPEASSESMAPETFPAVPTSLASLEANYEGIAYSSWKNKQRNLELYPNSDLKVSFKFGPNTPERYSTSITKDALMLGSRVMGAQKQPSEIRFVAYTKTDVEWAKREVAQYVSPFSLGISLPDQAAEKCSGQDCDGAVTNIASGIGLVLVGVSTPVNRYNIQQFKGQNDVHEFVHAVQGMIFASQGGKPPATRTPCWFSEGQPQAISIVATSVTYQDYVSARKNWITNNRWLLKDFEPESIEEFMRAGMKVPCPANTNAMNFSLGYIIIDALVAAGGIDKTFDIQKEISTGATFESAFEKVYGMSWVEGSTVLARVASRTYKEIKR